MSAATSQRRVCRPGPAPEQMLDGLVVPPDARLQCTILHGIARFMSRDPPEDRRITIAARLTDGQSLSATALAEEFGVSADAIRRDLRALAAEGRCRRVYGGALPLSPASTPMRTRSLEAPARKAALAMAAVTAIRPGEFLFL